MSRPIRSVNRRNGSVGSGLATSPLLVNTSYLSTRGPCIDDRLATSSLLVNISYLVTRGLCNVSDWLNENRTTNQRRPFEKTSHFANGAFGKMAIFFSSLSLKICLDFPRSLVSSFIFDLSLLLDVFF